MSESIQSNHHTVILNNLKLAEALQDAVKANDLPGMADVDSSLLLFCKEIKKKSTVALSGECADEISEDILGLLDLKILMQILSLGQNLLEKEKKL